MSRYDRIEALLTEWGEPRFRFEQLTHAVFTERKATFDTMTTLPKKLIGRLSDEFGPSILGLAPETRSVGDQADKVLFALPDGERSESVHMTFKAGWHSYCISSQVGCGYGCTFCASGAIGLKRNLTVDEITDQILFFHLDGLPIDSVSFMGMGEALANPHLFEALDQLTSPRLFGLAARRLSVSTIGLPSKMRRMTEEFPQVNLTLSVHSPFADQRSELMPINLRHPLDEVLGELDRHVAETNRKVYLAYVLMEDVNDSDDHIDALADLVRARPNPTGLYHVNLIRYNAASYIDPELRRSREKRIKALARRLADAGVKATVRQSFGVDIDAACGQLYARYASVSEPQPVAIGATR